MPSTMILGSPAGPDGAGGAFQNTVEADRAALWDSLGARQRVLRGFGYTAVAGQMALDLAVDSAALVGERAADGTASLQRGYHVYTPGTTATRIVFNAASASARNDAVVAAFVDTEDGALGTGVSAVGPQVVVVTGVSGVTVPRTDAEVNAFIGRGGWVRLYDVPIASTDTQINVANIVSHVPVLGGAVTGPATQSDYLTASGVVVTLAVSVLVGRRYQIAADVQANQVTTTGIVNCTMDTVGARGGLQASNSRVLWLESTPAGNTVYGSTTALYIPTSTGIETFRINASSTAGAVRFGVNGARLHITDVTDDMRFA